MLGTARLLTFSIRALALLIVISILWISAAQPYNRFLAVLAQPIAPQSIEIEVLGASILFHHPDASTPTSIDALTLHYGLILLAVLVLSAVGVRMLPRIGWLIALLFGAIVTHVVGIALLAQGVAWVAVSESPAESSRVMFSLFAVSWGLIPALVAGVWCVMYWIPAVSKSEPSNAASDETFDAPLSSS